MTSRIWQQGSGERVEKNRGKTQLDGGEGFSRADMEYIRNGFQANSTQCQTLNATQKGILTRSFIFRV